VDKQLTVIPVELKIPVNNTDPVCAYEKAKPGSMGILSGPLALLQHRLEKAHAQIIQD
jgi:hypothetical protein